MKKIYQLILAIFLLIITITSTGQVAYSPVVESLTQEITEESLMELENQLTGTVPTIIGGEEYTIATRNAFTEGNEKAAQWIYERLEEFGLEPWYHEYDANGTNVLAKIEGSEFPDQQYIICGHYDDMPSGSLAPGADDNASGTVAVLEAARILADQSPKYTIIFALWDEEEYGLIGSEYYAEEAADNGDDILGVINLDMIAWESEGDFMVSITNNEISNDFTMDFVDIMNLYEPEMENNFITSTASDHASFWNEGYPALLLIEDMDDFNEYYHTTADDVSILNLPYFEKLSRAAFAGLITFAFDYFVEMDHEPLLSGPSTAARQAKLVVEDLEEMDGDENQPRLYYGVNDEEFEYINAYDTDEDTLFFLIPGQALGTTVDYYFAVQGDDGGYIATLPTGGRGVNPPGTEAPGELFSYIVDEIYNDEYCSENTPMDIVDNGTMTDTISIEDEGVILDVNVMLDITHTYVGDLVISLKGSNEEVAALTIANGGGGDDFDHTIFDDEASQSIINGSAPFQGSYQPQQPLSVFNESDMQGEWVLTVTDNYSSDDGTLDDWCLILQYGPVSGVDTDAELAKENSMSVYPNPARDFLNIKLSVYENTSASIVIYDMFGREVKSIHQQSFNAGNHSIVTNLNGLRSGQYIVRMESGNETLTKKLIINR